MKNKLVFILLVLFGLFLIGCENNTSGNEGGNGDGNEDKPSSELDIQFSEISSYIKDNIPFFITEDIELTNEYLKYGAYIEWSSSNEDILDFAGNVSINRQKAIEVQLTYTVFIGENEKQETLSVIVTPATPEQVSDRFSKQFSNLITRDYEVVDNYYDLFTIEWISTNANVFTNDGIYVKPIEDTEFEIKYVVKCKDYTSQEFSRKLIAAGVSDAEKLAEVENWIKNEILADLYLTEEVSLPNVYEKYNIPITWESTNPDVVSNDGKIKHYVFERYVTLICTYELENGSKGVFKAECIVSPLDTSKMSEQQILENFLSAIALNTYSKVKFGYSECPELSTTYGSLYFYTNTESEVVEMLIPIGTSNRSQKAMDPQLVVIHDTANYKAGALANAKYVQSGYSNSSTGWHYTTGNDGIYQTLPENECGAHANGTQSTKFELVDTGIKAVAKKPQVTIGDDNYIYISGQKTNFMLPNKDKKFADDGVMCEIGENGNYWISKIWYCESHGFNANLGGNGSGVGIESAVKKGDDYMMTVRKTAKLTAEILLRHDLGVNRVVQHNTTSGKNCPQAIREANYWYTFKDFVAMEKWAKENLSEYQFIWTSTCPIMNNEGYISLDLKGLTSVSYSVVVSKNSSKVLEKSFSTKLV